MKKSIFTTVAVLALGLSTYGANVQVAVTPQKLEPGNFVFSVANNATNGGTAFHVSIAVKNGTIPFSCGADLAVVRQPTDTTPFSIAGVKPAITVNLAKTDRLWTADLIASDDVLNQPNVYFIFVVPDYETTADGKQMALPSEKIYEIKLQDFIAH